MITTYFIILFSQIYEIGTIIATALMSKWWPIADKYVPKVTQ